MSDENENKDGVQDGIQDGTQDAPETTNDESPKETQDTTEEVTETIPKATEEDISERLSQEQTEEAADDGGVKGKAPVAFDISQLSREQLQTLKSVLAATPDAAGKKKDQKNTAALRKISGKIVVDFKPTYKKLVDDPENLRQVMQLTIPVRFNKENDFVDIIYNEFINSERVDCEILNIDRDTDEKIVGETISRETGLPVDMVIRYEKTAYTVKLPDGEELTVDSRIINA